MRLRSAPTAIATFIVAIVVALTVPISQLQTVSTTITCCCPDPTNCHCPHTKQGPSDCPSMAPCHQERHDGFSPQAPSFTSPEVAIAIAPPRITPALFVAPGVPHAEPSTSEPYGPS